MKVWTLLLLALLGCHVPDPVLAAADGGALTYHVARTGRDTPTCGTPASPCLTAVYALNHRVPRVVTRKVQVIGDLTAAERAAEARAHGMDPPDEDAGCKGASGALSLCGNVFVDTTINGCLVNGSGSKAIVLCPDGGTELPPGIVLE